MHTLSDIPIRMTSLNACYIVKIEIYNLKKMIQNIMKYCLIYRSHENRKRGCKQKHVGTLSKIISYGSLLCET